MSVIGIGIDAVSIERFKDAAETRGEHFLRKIFTEKEIEYAGTKKAQYMHMAGKFAAKEAIKKALPEGSKIGLNWPEIEILNSQEGKPYAVLHGRAKEVADKFNINEILVSISHTEDLATSNAMAVKNGT